LWSQPKTHSDALLMYNGPSSDYYNQKVFMTIYKDEFQGVLELSTKQAFDHQT
jgi:hypothetical protein